METLKWLAETGTNEWLGSVWTNNWYVLTFFGAVVGGFVKGKWPNFFSNLKTAMPFVGNPKKF